MACIKFSSCCRNRDRSRFCKGGGPGRLLKIFLGLRTLAERTRFSEHARALLTPPPYSSFKIKQQPILKLRIADRIVHPSFEKKGLGGFKKYFPHSF